MLADTLAFGTAVLITGTDLDGRVAAWAGVTGVLLGLGGAYRSRLTLSVLGGDLASLSGRVLAAAALVRASTLGPGAAGLRHDVVFAVTLLASLLAARALAHVLIRRVRSRAVGSHPTLVIGAGDVGDQLVRVIADRPEFGLRPVGFLDDDPKPLPHERAAPVIGGLSTLTDVVRDLHVDRVIIAFTQTPESDVVDIIRACDRLHCEIFQVPRLFELAAKERDTDEILGFPLIRFRRAAYRTVRWRLKRVIDVAVSGAALAVLAVPLLAITGLLRLTQGPGVIFRQERIGVDGRLFPLLKFRTLSPADEQEAATLWNISDDGRVTPLARFLRRSSLDELPQLINILRGDMSLVGPRPERPHFVTEFAATFPRYPARHRVPCGLTGWAQVNGLRGDTSIEERARFDNYYIENWSLWLDVRIMLRTAVAFARGT